jgi:hypothetical protein
MKKDNHTTKSNGLAWVKNVFLYFFHGPQVKAVFFGGVCAIP